MPVRFTGRMALDGRAHLGSGAARIASLICLAWWFLPVVSFAQPVYNVTSLGTPAGYSNQANGVNNVEQVVGFQQDVNIFLWQNGDTIPTNLGFLPGGHKGQANDINAAGQVVGESDLGNSIVHAFLWQGGVMTDLGSLASPANSSSAWAINSLGTVVGYSYLNGAEKYAVLWQNGGIMNLGSLGGKISVAYGINKFNQVVGQSSTDIGNNVAFVWDNGVMVNLGTPGLESRANAINDAGIVVGFATTSVGDQNACFWAKSGGVWTRTDIGTLGGSSAQALGINQQGQIVGSSFLLGDGVEHAFVWQNGVKTDLNTLIPPTSGWVLTRASSINDKSEIVGEGLLGGVNSKIAYILMAPNGKTDPTINWPKPADIYYGTGLSAVQMNATATVPGTFQYSFKVGDILNAKPNQPLSVTFTPTDTVHYNTVQVQQTITVLPVPLSVKADNASRLYGTPNPDFTGAVTGLVNGDPITFSFTTTASAASPIGTYTIIPVFSDPQGRLPNYNPVTYVNGTLTVNPIPLIITANNQSKTYGMTFTFGGTEFTTSGLVNKDTVASASLASAGAVASATVAGSTYPISISGASGTGLDNYTITYVPGALTVSPAPLTITANSRSKTYGQSVAFAGTELTPAGLLNSDTVFSASLASAGAAASATVAGSTYPISINGASGTGLDNYSITYIPGALTVNPAPLTITANSWSKTYGQSVTFAGTEFTSSGLLNSDTVTSAILASAGAAVTATVAGSTYPISISSAIGTGLGNYSITYVSGTLTVNPAPLTITAGSTSKKYGEIVNFAIVQCSIVGLLNGDTVSSVSLASDGAPPTATVAGSPYALTPSNASGSALANYTIMYVPGTITVSPAVLTVTADNKSKYINTANPALTASYNGFVNNDTVSALTGNPALSTTATTASPVGTYPITVAQGTLSAANYTFAFVNGILTVLADPGPTSLVGFTTYTQGGWGAVPRANNPASFLAVNFAGMYPNGVVIGGNNKLLFSSSGAVEKYLPAGGTAATLIKTYTNPLTTEAGVFAGQVLALQLNVDFSNLGKTKAGLATLKVAPGYKLAGYTVGQVLTVANQVLGGNTGALPTGCSISDLNNVADSINKNFDNGTKNLNFLVLP